MEELAEYKKQVVRSPEKAIQSLDDEATSIHKFI